MTGDVPAANQIPDSAGSQAYIFGGLIGLLMGIVSAHLFLRASQETGRSASRIKTIDGLKLAVSALAMVRQITDLGAGGKD